MMPPHPPLFKRKQTNNTSPTSVNANLITTNHNHIENNQQQTNVRNNRISTIQKKRNVWICIAIATLFALRLLKVQNLKIEQTTIAQDIVSNKNESSTNNDHQVVIDAPPIQPRVRFIPYPHKTLGSGASVQCQWETRHNIIPTNDTSSSTTILDFTQQSAYTEGICIPPTLENTIHIFSSAEAIQCLSSEIQQRDIRVILSGDSYMKQLYIGLADILLSKHISDDKQMRDSQQRRKVLSTAHYWMKKRHERNATFPFVQYQCEDECYGKNALDVCSQCITSFSGNTNHSNDDDVWVVGVGVHTYARANRQVDIAVQNIQQFLDTEQEHNRTIYVSPPHYFHREDYPTQSINMERLYRGLLPHVAPENAAHPFLDVFELTQSCTMENCTYDGGHRSRYVNRWKAQLLLNMLCEVR